jgi:probable addiction module antidote protein
MNDAPRDASHDDFIEERLKDPEFAVEYLKAVMEDDDPAVLLIALRHVARAHGMAEVTRRAELGEKTLFKSLSEAGNPTLATVRKVLHAVGLRLSVAPIEAHAGAQ